MDVTRTTLPGKGPGRGVVHQLVTRRGQRFGVLVEEGGRRQLVIYDAADPDASALGIVLDQDESDQVADLLHSRPVSQRLADLERRVAEIAEAAR